MSTTSARARTRRSGARSTSSVPPPTPCAGTWSAGCRPTKREASWPTPAPCTRSIAPKLARALADAAAERRSTPLDVFLQISLDDDPERGGVAVADLPRLAAAVVERSELRLRGVMAVPPIGSDAAAAFTHLRELSLQLQVEHPAATAISAGMSADLEAAVRHGSTHVRVGTALLGRRSPIFS